MNSAKYLLNLQNIDHRMAIGRSAFRKIVAQLESEGELKSLRGKSDAARLVVLEKRLECSRLEAQITDLKEKLADNEKRLYGGSITNIRELTALEEQHTSTSRELARAEELAPEARSAADEAQRQHEGFTQQLGTQEKEWKTTKRELKIEAKKVSDECEQLMVKRSGTVADIDQEDLALYNSLLPRKNGTAVAMVERGICQGCRIKLPIREISRLTSSRRLVVCSSCGRILLAT